MIEPENTGIIRDERGRFLSGHSGNSRGKPKGSLSITARIKEELEKIPKGFKISYLEVLVKIILKKALLEGDREMIKTIWQYIDGTPKQHMDIKTEEDLNEIKMIIVENRNQNDKTN